MNTPSVIKRNQATLKLLFVGFLSLAMLIPLVMIGVVIAERQELQREAAHTIAQRWGGIQHIGGLVMLREHTVTWLQDGAERSREEWRARVPRELEIQAALATEMRYLGIYEVPVYTTQVTLSGQIERDTELSAGGELLLWLPLSDVRGVREISSLRIEGLEFEARPLGVHNQLISGLQFAVNAEQIARLGPATTLNYELELKLAGSDSLMFLPLADKTEVRLQADWPHPEFVGQYLPVERSINTESVEARWQLLGLNRPYGDEWVVTAMPTVHLNGSGFGMRLETPVDAYQRSERSVKYGFLFIALTFFTLFLFEVMTGQPLHPVPYVLTGAALAVFYLVLLALSEYLPFAWAFAVAAALLVAIVTPYTGAVLGRRRRGYLVGLMLSLTYLLLYILVTAQHASLLLGSLSLLLAIGALMYLTRGVDWYSYGRSGV